MNWFKKALHIHTWHVIAFDDGYNTTYDEPNIQPTAHHLTFLKCDCGARKITGNEVGHASRHSGVIKAGHAWVESNELMISPQASVYNDDYQPSTSPIGKYSYRPLTGIQRIIASLKADEEFSKLHHDNKLVADALAEFETIIKLHEGL